MFSNEKCCLRFFTMSYERRKEMLLLCLIIRIISSLLKNRNLEFVKHLAFCSYTSCSFSLNLFLKFLKFL